jgi:hypothetical protein
MRIPRRPRNREVFRPAETAPVLAAGPRHFGVPGEISPSLYARPSRFFAAMMRVPSLLPLGLPSSVL